MCKRKFLIAIMLFVIALLGVFVFLCTEDKVKDLSEIYIEDTKDKVSVLLVEKGYDYNNVQVEYRYNYNGYNV